MQVIQRRASVGLGHPAPPWPAPWLRATWSPPSAASRVAKRTLDIAASLAVLLLSLPVLLVAVAAIRLESPGSALFRQQRLREGGNTFTILKLRTMRSDGDEQTHSRYVEALIDGRATTNGGLYKLRDDDRRTRVGAVLRRTSLDELPQLINVLMGSMSLVGPRPSTPEEAMLWDERTRQRLLVKPGITGLWQVSGRSRLTYDEMVDLDLRYAATHTVWLDLWILLRTPLALLRAETA